MRKDRYSTPDRLLGKMPTNIRAMDMALQNEQVVRAYFEARPGWTVTKLDMGGKRAADFRVCDGLSCFLCEVKTIQSVRANLPFSARVYYPLRRKRHKADIKKWRTENPDKHLLLRSDEWTLVYGKRKQFEERYLSRNRNTDACFQRFEQAIKDHTVHSGLRDIPFDLRIDSDDLYVPKPEEIAKFFEWLEDQMTAIAHGNVDWPWHVERLQYGQAAVYSAFYNIHKPVNENDVEAVYQLTLEGPRGDGPLTVGIYSYGQLNLDAITSEVEKGRKQLASSASQENDRRIPRIIVLAFRSGIGSDWQELGSYIDDLLKTYPDLSAIAVLDWAPDGTPPPPEDGFMAWSEFQAKTPRVPIFSVYPNPYLQDSKPLPGNVFDDRRSVQLSPKQKAQMDIEA